MGALPPRYWPLLKERGLWSWVGPHGHLSYVMPGSLRGRDGTPHWTDGETGTSPRGLWALSAVPGFGAATEADAVCGAGVPSSGRRAPPRPAARAAQGPTARSPGRQVPCWSHPRSSLLLSHFPRAENSLSRTPFSWLPRDPKAAARPAPIAMETACTQFPPSHPPCPRSGRTSARLGGSPLGRAAAGP